MKLKNLKRAEELSINFKALKSRQKTISHLLDSQNGSSPPIPHLEIYYPDDTKNTITLSQKNTILFLMKELEDIEKEISTLEEEVKNLD